MKKILKGKDVEIFPDFPKGGLVDVSGYNQGNGRIKCRARIEDKDEKTKDEKKKRRKKR